MHINQNQFILCSRIYNVIFYCVIMRNPCSNNIYINLNKKTNIMYIITFIIQLAVSSILQATKCDCKLVYL